MKEVLLTSSVLILALTVLRFCFRNSISRRLQYALWLLVGLRLLIPVSLLPASSFSVMTGAQALSQRWEVSTEQTIPGTAVDSSDVAAADFGFVELPDATVTPSQNAPAGTDTPLTVDAEASAPAEVTFTWAQIAGMIWAAGAVVVLGWLLAVNLRFGRQLRKTRQAVDVEGSPLPVYVTDAIVSPCLFGLFRPAVYLTPKALETEDSLRHVLTHELCHYRHGDHVWALLRSVLLAVYWFDPLVWLAAALSRADSELACDEAVLRKLGADQRLAYGKTLVDMVAVRRTPTGILCAATTMTSGKRSLKERLGRIVRKPRVAIPAVIAVVLLASVCVACTFSGAETVDAEPEETDTSDTSDQTSAAEVTFTLAKVENGVETPIDDPDGFLAGEIFFDAMVKSAAAPAVELPDSYYILREKEQPTDSGEAIVREHQIFRLFDGVGPFDLGTPVLQHGDMYTAIHYELMARLEAAANPVTLPAASPDPKASAHQDVLIDYADENIVIFHGYFGLFVYDRATSAITHSLDLDAAIGTSQVYDTSDSYAEVAVSRDGRVLRVAARGDAVPLEALWIDTATWTGGTGPWAELREPFDGGKTTVTTENAETISIDPGSGLIGEIQLVTEEGARILFTGVAPTPTNLDDAIAAAVKNRCSDPLSDEYLTEAHWLLGTEATADGTVTAYTFTSYISFAGDANGIEVRGVSAAMPMVLTFQQEETGLLQLTDMQLLEDLPLTRSSPEYTTFIAESFPPELTAAATNLADIPGGDDYMLSLSQSCYAEAVSHFHLNCDPVIEGYVNQLVRKLDQGQEINSDDLSYRTLLCFGDDTLRYVIPQLLEANPTGNRRTVLEELLWTVHPGDVQGLTSPELNGDPTFEDMKDYAKSMADEYGVEYFAGNRTASILLWNLGYSTATMPQYEEIDRLVEMICSTPSEASSTAAYLFMHPVETATLQSYGDATLKYCFYAFLRQDSEGLRGAVLWSLMDSMLGGEAIGYDAADAQDYFNHWQGAILQTFEDNGEAYMRQNMPCGTILLECMGLLEAAN